MDNPVKDVPYVNGPTMAEDGWDVELHGIRVLLEHGPSRVKGKNELEWCWTVDPMN